MPKKPAAKKAPAPPPAAEPPALRMPAEWEPHAATWIAWPHNKDDWPGRFAPVPWVYAEIVRKLHVGERVAIVVLDDDHRRDARKKLRRAGVDLGRVDFHEFPTDRVWTRDTGPVFVVDREGGLQANHWVFNGWAKYDDHKADRKLGARIAKAVGVPVREPTHAGKRIVLEGGSIDVNGAGCLLTTEECLLSEVQQRNPGMSRADYEAAFAGNLGVRKTLWLNRGVAGDDTHGHVDDLARFVDPTTVVVVQESDETDDNFVPLRENWERLSGATDQDGRRLTVVALPMPRPVLFDGQRLPASYANFYIGNSVVLVPTFNDPADRAALGILAELFPTRTVTGIHCVELAWGLGTLHCMTQQQPAAR
jgi:agmatine deiminase